MSDNEFKTETLRLTMTVLPSGSVTVESDQGETYTFLNDTGILRFAGAAHWHLHELRLRGKQLKDHEGYVWSYVDDMWRYWFKGGGRWEFDVPIEDYVEDGFTIVESLD